MLLPSGVLLFDLFLASGTLLELVLALGRLLWLVAFLGTPSWVGPRLGTPSSSLGKVIRPSLELIVACVRRKMSAPINTSGPSSNI